VAGDSCRFAHGLHERNLNVKLQELQDVEQPAFAAGTGEPEDTCGKLDANSALGDKMVQYQLQLQGPLVVIQTGLQMSCGSQTHMCCKLVSGLF